MGSLLPSLPPFFHLSPVSYFIRKFAGVLVWSGPRMVVNWGTFAVGPAGSPRVNRMVLVLLLQVRAQPTTKGGPEREVTIEALDSRHLGLSARYPSSLKEPIILTLPLHSPSLPVKVE